MPRTPAPGSALSEVVSITLILLLLVLIALIVYVVFIGHAGIAPKSAYIAMKAGGVNTSAGADTIAIFHLEGDAVNLNESRGGDGVAPVSFNLRTPSGSTESVRTSPQITDNTWNSGDTITIYEDATGYWVTDDIEARIAESGTTGPLVDMPGGNYTVNVVDMKAGVLISSVPVTISGPGTTGIQYSPGLIATYYNDIGWITPAATNIAYRIYFADAASGRASVIANWPVGLIGKAEQFSVKYDGYFKAETEDDYTFILASDDGSWMDLNGVSDFINNERNHSYTERRATMHLTPGYYPVTVRMYEYTGAAVVYLTYTTPSSPTPQAVTQLYHIPSTAPVADFSGHPSAGSPPLKVQFTDQSVDASSWSWNFGDGAGGSFVKNPSHTYTAPGKYSVTLVATNSFGSSTVTKTNYITVGSFSPGFSASYYRGQSWDDFAGGRVDAQIQFTDQGVSTWPSDIVGRKEDFSVVWEGYLHVPAEDTYTFYLNSDDGSFMDLDGTTNFINNGGDHAAREYTESATLTEGYHHIVVRMYERTGVAVAHLRYTNSAVTSPQYVTDVWHI